MKNSNKIFIGSAVAFTMTALLTSCSMDEPFGPGAEASLTLNTEIRGDVTKTRAEVAGDELSSLRQKCVVYIENNKGVIRKWKGLDNIPESITLRAGEYVAEAWSGDSVSASFDAKFYRGYQKFEMSPGANTLTLKCNIANVLVSVDPASLDVNLSDIKVTFSHSRGLLELTESNITEGAKGYFMMPNADKDLSYKVEGKKADGSPFSRTGKIENVARAHEYCMTISQDDQQITQGGALINLTIADIPVIDEEVEIFPAPVVTGVGFDASDQIVNLTRDFSDIKLCVLGYFGLSTVSLNVNDSENTGIISGQNILETSVRASLEAKGVRVERVQSKDAASASVGGEVLVDKVYITFSKAFLDALPVSASQYVFTIECTDEQHKVGVGSLRIANSIEAMDVVSPVSSADAPDPDKEPMAIGARRAVITGYVNDAASAMNFGIKYREQGQSDWMTAYPESSVASSVRRKARSSRALEPVPYTVTLTDLKPGTTYEFKAFCDDYEDADVNRFTTESVFTIPNASFEEWSTYTASTILGTKTVILPGAGGDKTRSFWGSGNEGAATAGKVLTNKSGDMVHSGAYSVRMASSSAMSVLAAGNIFVGLYDRTDGTNGVLQLGREYNGTHPSKLRVFANYRPGIVNIIKEANKEFLDFVKGDSDHGQIYVALTDGPIEIRTNPDNRKLFNKDEEHVLAYGQVTWKEAFGPDGQLQMVEIPIVYNERAETKRPTHIVITACASKFGDFFSGSDSSVMYLDDFELVYE